MVAQVPIISKPVSPQCAALARAFERARAERLVCYPAGQGAWECKSYTILETGPRSQDVICSCVAGQRGLTCKHAVCVIFCRKHGVRPIKPLAPSTAPEVAYTRHLMAETTASLIAGIAPSLAEMFA